jgi:serine/threonine protein phosphatase PrpC
MCRNLPTVPWPTARGSDWHVIAHVGDSRGIFSMADHSEWNNQAPSSEDHTLSFKKRLLGQLLPGQVCFIHSFSTTAH